MNEPLDLKNKTFGRLIALYPTDKRKNGKVVWHCKCTCEDENEVDVPSNYLLSGDIKSCGCLKRELEEKHLREEYDNKRVDGVAMQLFKGVKPRKDSSTGYRGVAKYLTRKSKEVRYRAWITVQGKRYYKSGFKTPEEAYYEGRLKLEEQYLPKAEEHKDDQ